MWILYKIYYSTRHFIQSNFRKSRGVSVTLSIKVFDFEQESWNHFIVEINLNENFLFTVNFQIVRTPLSQDISSTLGNLENGWRVKSRGDPLGVHLNVATRYRTGEVSRYSCRFGGICTCDYWISIVIWVSKGSLQ